MISGDCTCLHFDQFYLRNRISEVVSASREGFDNRGRSVDGG
jgi:hypothetical protein